MTTATISLLKLGAVTTDKPFWVTPPEVMSYIKTTYIDTGLMTETTTLGEDGKTRTVTQNFKDEASKTKWFTDPILSANAENRKAYHAQHGITEANQE